MSRPYQFTEESSRSPLDPKPQNVFPAGQPPSFKTNVNRMKTKRWVEAKSFSYDGDDWGEYDEYDEYGANEQPPPPPKPTTPTDLRQKGQSAGEPGRSFTDPQAAGPPPIPRKNSFNAGDERRAFSAAVPPPAALNQKAPIDTTQIHTNNGAVGEARSVSPVAAPPGQQSIHQYPASNGQRPQVAVQIPSVVRQTSVAQSDTSDTPQNRRDFSPSALPPPLQTRMSSAPGSATASPAGARFPTRKSSLSQSSPSEPAGSPFTQSAPSNMPSAPPRERTPSNAAKPLPFIRPADIYKRVHEEREKERQSLESSRPSLDSLMSRPGEDAPALRGLKERSSSESLGKSSGRRPSLERLGDGYETGRTLQPMLEPVAERKSEYLPDFSLPSQGVQSAATQPVQPKSVDQVSQTPALPQVHRLSTFGDDFWSSATASAAAPSPAAGKEVSNQSPYGDPGFRSVVGQAFDRTDDHSVPPTPISKQSESGMSRSNTDSTSGISPIMSRVPSSATSALKARSAEARETSTPAIAEETSDTSTPTSRPVSAAMLGGVYQIPRKPSPNHSRNASGGSIPGLASAAHHSGLNTPSPADSPARSPAIEPQKLLPEPETAVISSLSPTSPSPIEGGLGNPSTNYATREADIASAMRQSPEKEVSGLGEAEKESQVAFLESHKDIKAPTFEHPPRSRSGSPSKGRVQELAGKFNEISESRRNSAHSITSKNSVSSWERSQEDLTLPTGGAERLTSKSRTSTPDNSTVKETPADRPVADRGASFRPQLPGQWESYTTATTPSEKGESNAQIGHGDACTVEQSIPVAPTRSREEAVEEIDLTPTTVKHPVAVSDPSKPTSNPIAALQAAGTAMGEAIKASVGMGKGPSDAEIERDSKSKDPPETHGYSVGDVYLRPLQLDRTASSIASSAPPTPPPKDNSFENATPESEDLPPPVPLKQKSPEPSSPTNNELTPTRPAMLPQLSTDPSLHDQESDKLRKEIVLSLSPLKTSGTLAPEPSRASLQPNGPLVNNRDSSILPAEYESYWADGGTTSQPTELQPSRPSEDTNSRVPEPISEVSGAQLPPEPAPTTIATSSQTSYGARPGLLDQRFSWEQDSAGFSPESAPGTEAVPGAELSEAAKEPKAISPTLRLVEEEPMNKLYGAPTTSLSPTHADNAAQPTPSVVEPEPSAQRSRTPPAVAETSKGTSQPQNAGESTPPRKLSIEGLHVVNSEYPEAVDLPPRLSVEAVQKPPPPPQPQSPSREAAPMGPRPQTAQARTSQAISVRDKPPGFREILAIKSSSDRIATYNMAREHFARPNTGLSTWLTAIVAANPEPSPLANLPTRPTVLAAGPSRHKHTGSISLFGKLSASNSQPQATPYFEQYNAAASQLPTHVGPSTLTPAPQGNQQSVSGAGAGGKGTSHQRQAKGKDLLHSAGVLGGKATIGAKGLFAKGKSRFRGSGGADKAARTSSISSATASREASEEPEWVTTPEKNERGTTSFDLSDRKDKKEKKRRLSSPFNRSKSRPSSDVLPRNQQLDFTAGSLHVRGTPPKETPPTEGSRPHSYAAPDSWNIQDPDQQNLRLTPPRTLTSTPDRLGILPSPAKSAFSLVQQEKDGDIPPVPPIPRGMEEWQKERGEDDQSQAHRNLQSVIRHSTPPVLETFPQQNPGDLTEEDVQQPASAGTKSPVTIEPLDNPPTAGKDLSKPATAAPQSVDPPASGPDDVSPILPQEEEDDDKPPQLHHEPLPTTAVPQHLRQPLDISPASAPQASESGDISPVASSEDHHRLSFNDDQEDTPTRQEPDFATTKPQHQTEDPEDVSPVMTSPATSGFPGKENHNNIEVDIREGLQTPKGRPAYETELIGAGDVSPVSSEDHRKPVSEDEETTPIKHTNSGASEHVQSTIAGVQDHVSQHTSALLAMQKEGPITQSQQTGIEMPTPGVDAPGAFPETPAETPNEFYDHSDTKPTFVAPPVPKQFPPPPPSQALRVMQAVEYAPPRSSIDSWEEDSISEPPSHPDEGPFADPQEDVATTSNPGGERQLHEFNAHVQGQEPQQQPEVQQNPLPVAHQEEQSEKTPVRVPERQQSPEQEPVHETPRNLISLLSSAVSAEGTPTSTKSNRSIWSRASNRQAPVIISVPRNTVQAPTQNTGAARESQPEMPSPVRDDGYDLYADHDGTIRDLHDEKTGEPIRIAPVPVSVVPASAPAIAEPPVQQPPVPLEVVVTPRERAEQSPAERPMSFVSLPRDAKGRPQEQINREDVVVEEASRGITPQPQMQAPAAEPTTMDEQQPRGEGQPQLVALRSEEQKQIPLTEEQARQTAAAAAARQPERGMGPSPGAQQQQMIPPQAREQVRQQAGSPQSVGATGPLPSQAGQPLQTGQPLRGPQEQYRYPTQQVSPGQPVEQGQYVQDPRMQDPRIQDPRMRDPRRQDPRMQDPRVQDPRVQDPRVQDPRMQDPRMQDPRMQDPRMQDPRMQDRRMPDPRIQDSHAQDPQMQDPQIQDPRMQAPRMQAPRMQDPRMQDPRTQDPRMQDPRMQDPRMQDPRMQDSRFQDPRLQDPRTQDPQMQDPRFQDPRLQDPRFQDPRFQDPRMQDPRVQGPRMQDPRMQGRIAGQPYPQDPRVQAQERIPGQPYPMDPRMQGRPPGQPYPQDPRMQGQQYGSPPLPRDEYEAQQMMTRQAMDPRLLGAEYQLPGVGPPPGHAQQGTPEAGRLKVVSSVFKGRAHPSPVQPPSNNRINPQLTSPEDVHRSFSYQSSLGDLPEHQTNDKKKQRKSSIFSSLSSRPQSVGTESHISQESTVAHAADSRLDLRYPTSPAPFKGIPPQVPPPGAPANLSKIGKNAQLQPQRASTTGVPDTGKKKRFSGLGSFFGRSGTTGHSPPAKPNKLSKKEEKASKAPKQPIQQHQQPQAPPQLYPQPPPANRQVPQGYPIPPQYLPPQGVPQQYYPPPGPQRNPSAYVETRTVVQPPNLPPQVQPSVSPPTRQLIQRDTQPTPLSTTPSFERTVGRIDEAGEEPPPGGYYAPQRWSHGHGASGFAAIAQQTGGGQQPPTQRRVSSTSSIQNSQNPVTTPISQRRVSSPHTEPRYETPQIPASYSNGVSGHPPTSQPAPQPTNLPDQVATAARGQSPSQYGTPARQHSDPHRPNISPQVSGQSQMTPGSHRASASPPVVSPISNPSPGMPQQQSPPPPQQQYQRGQQPRMGSISEASHQERPWNISLPIDEGGEDEVAYIRQQQQMQMQQQLVAQNQIQEQTVRNGHTPSPHPPQNYQAPAPASGPALQGFREVLPRGSPQPYPMRQPHQSPQPQPPQKQPSPHPSQHLQPPPHSQTPQPQQPAPVHPYQLQTSGSGLVQAAAYPLPTSPGNATSPINPLAATLPPPPPPPPKIPHSPLGMHPDNPTTYGPPPQQPHPQQPQAPPYQEQAYDPAPPHPDYDESRRDSLPVPLSHPQPATMAAQPQRTSSDMGANMLRQRLLEAEERERIERMQRADEERVESERERAERDRARARARELERGRGSTASRSSAWERNRGPTQAFELSAEEDEEPVMRGVSYPGMEWTPMWDGD